MVEGSVRDMCPVATRQTLMFAYREPVTSPSPQTPHNDVPTRFPGRTSESLSLPDRLGRHNTSHQRLPSGQTSFTSQGVNPCNYCLRYALAYIDSHRERKTGEKRGKESREKEVKESKGKEREGRRKRHSRLVYSTTCDWSRQ